MIPDSRNIFITIKGGLYIYQKLGRIIKNQYKGDTNNVNKRRWVPRVQELF